MEIVSASFSRKFIYLNKTDDLEFAEYFSVLSFSSLYLLNDHL